MDYRRHYQPGSTYFFTVVTQYRRPLLVENIGKLRKAFQLMHKRYPCEIQAIVILPDHLHTIWRLPDGDSDYSRRWMILKRAFSASIPANPATRSQVSKREKGIWQRRFWEHTIRNEDDWARHLDYIHYNPVKHGYVDSPADWAYSSFSRWVSMGLYCPNWGASEPPGMPNLVGE